MPQRLASRIPFALRSGFRRSGGPMLPGVEDAWRARAEVRREEWGKLRMQNARCKCKRRCHRGARRVHDEFCICILKCILTASSAHRLVKT